MSFPAKVWTYTAALTFAGCAQGCSSRAISLGEINGDAGADAAAATEWIATVPGLGGQLVKAVGVGTANRILIAGDQPGANESELLSNIFLGALSAADGTQQWLQPVAGRDLGWVDSAAAVFPNGANDVWLLGTFRDGVQDPLSFADVFATSSGASRTRTTLYVPADCDEPASSCEDGINSTVEAGALVGDTLFSVGSIVDSFGQPTWLQNPSSAYDQGWGLVGATRGAQSLWARSLSDRTIRRATSILVVDNRLMVAALGSASTTSDDVDRPPFLWLLQMDLAGNVLQARFFAASEGLAEPKLAATAAGIVVVGGFSGTLVAGEMQVSTVDPADVFVMGINNENLSARWLLSLGGNDAADGGHAVVALANGDVAVACGTCVAPGGGPASDESSGPGLVRIGPDGIAKGFAPWTATGVIRVEAAAAANVGQAVVVGGSFTGRLGLPGRPQVKATDASDGFVLQVKAP